MKVVHVHRLRGVGGSERHLLTLLPALRERGIDATFVGLDDDDPDPFYAQLDLLGRPVRAAPGATRHRPGARLPAAEHVHAGRARTSSTPISSTPTSTARSRRGRADDRLDQAQRRSLPARPVPTRGAAVRSACRRGSSASPARSPTSTSNESACPPTRCRSSTTGSTTCRRPGGRPVARRCRPTRESCSPSRGSRSRRGSTSRSRRSPRSGSAIPTSFSSCSASGSQESALKALAAKLGVADAVYLAGSVGDVADWLRRAEMLVHPARWEGFGLALARGDAGPAPDHRERRQRDPGDRRRRHDRDPHTPGRPCSPPRRHLTGSSRIPRWPARTVRQGTNGRLTSFSVASMADRDDRRLPLGARAAPDAEPNDGVGPGIDGVTRQHALA